MLNSNNEFIKKYSSYIEEMYNNFIPDKENYIVTQSKDGANNLIIQKDDKKVFLHSSYNVLKEAHSFAENIDTSKDVVVIIGFAFGYHIQELAKVYKKEIIVIEPDFNIFYNCLNNCDIGDLLVANKITIFFENNSINIAKTISSHIHQGMDVGIYFWNSYKTLYESVTKELFDNIRYILEDLEINTRVQHFSSDVWIENFIMNLPKILNYPSAGNANDAYKGVPAIVVSAGASLNKNIDILKKFYGKALILSAGSAIGPLSLHGIKPHFTFGLDGWQTNMQIYNDSVDIDGITLVCNTEFYSGVVDKFVKNKNDIMFYTCSRDTNAFLKEEFNKDVAGYNVNFSVSYNAIQIAYTFGCDPIILVGQDLCYYEKNYADGAIFIDDVIEDDKKDMKEYKDIYGNLVYSDRSFTGIKSAIERWVKPYKDRQFFNCTEGGLNIEGFENRKLIEVANQFMQKQITKDILTNNNEAIDCKENLIAFKTKILDYLEKIDICLKDCTKYENRITKDSLNKNIKNVYIIDDRYKELLNDNIYTAFRAAISNTLEAYLAKYNRDTKNEKNEEIKVKKAFETYKKAFVYLQYKYKLILELLDKSMEFNECG